MECICSDRPLIVGDEGVDINLIKLCSRLEDSLGWRNNNNNRHDNNKTRVWLSLIEQVRQQNGGSKALSDIHHNLCKQIRRK